MKRIVDGAADFVGATARIFGTEPRVLDGSRAVLIGDLKLSLEAGERELWLIRMHSLALEERLAMVEVHGSIEEALTEAKAVVGA
ncbi:MAG TPA: hypothetical protein VE596_13425 [Gaiellaceae bacterium]|jgi:hypothetical protein|nr:hypothetical protein [Gaiellaceae bacterium]